MKCNKFSAMLHNLPSNQVGEVRERIIESTGKTRQTLYNWLKPEGAITPSIGDQMIICAAIKEAINMDVRPAMMWEAETEIQPETI